MRVKVFNDCGSFTGSYQVKYLPLVRAFKAFKIGLLALPWPKSSTHRLLESCAETLRFLKAQC
jgi:hypothetical protein